MPSGRVRMANDGQQPCCSRDVVVRRTSPRLNPGDDHIVTRSFLRGKQMGVIPGKRPEYNRARIQARSSRSSIKTHQFLQPLPVTRELHSSRRCYINKRNGVKGQQSTGKRLSRLGSLAGPSHTIVSSSRSRLPSKDPSKSDACYLLIDVLALQALRGKPSTNRTPLIGITDDFAKELNVFRPYRDLRKIRMVKFIISPGAIKYHDLKVALNDKSTGKPRKLFRRCKNYRTYRVVGRYLPLFPDINHNGDSDIDWNAPEEELQSQILDKSLDLQEELKDHYCFPAEIEVINLDENIMDIINELGENVVQRDEPSENRRAMHEQFLQAIMVQHTKDEYIMCSIVNVTLDRPELLHIIFK